MKYLLFPTLWKIPYTIGVAVTTKCPPCFGLPSFSIVEGLAVYRTTEIKDSRSQPFLKLGMAMRCPLSVVGVFWDLLEELADKIVAPT